MYVLIIGTVLSQLAEQFVDQLSLHLQLVQQQGRSDKAEYGGTGRCVTIIKL